MQRPVVLSLAAACGLVFAGCADRSEPAGPWARPQGNLVAATSVTVVMSGLDSPRGLAFGPEGALYVAEAGRSVPNGPCIDAFEGMTPTQKCWSGTGAISRLWKGNQERVASGLPSSYFAHNQLSSGPQDISFLGRGHAMVAVGFGGDPALRATFGGLADAAGTLIALQPGGGWRVIADLLGYEEDVNPAGGPVDANPYGVLAAPGRTYVTDAGGNSLLAVDANGDIALVALFPSTAAPPPFNTSEPVPTRVVRGPDGALYVSTLTGAPFVDGAAAVYRVQPGEPPTLYAGGFKAITDLAFTRDGSLLVLQFGTGPVFFAGPGLLIHVAPDGTRTTLLDNLAQPTGLAVGPDGAIYVSNRGTEADVGQVLRVTM